MATPPPPPPIDNDGNLDITQQEGTTSSSLEFRTSTVSETKEIVWKIENLSTLIAMAKDNKVVTVDSISFNAGEDIGMMSKWTYSITYGMHRAGDAEPDYSCDRILFCWKLNEYKGKGKTDKVYVKDSLTLKSPEDGKPVRTVNGEVKGRKALEKAWAWNISLQLEGLKTANLLVDDTLTVYITFTIYGNKRSLSLVTDEFVKKKARKQVKEKLVKGLGTLLDNGTFADFVIKVKVPKDRKNKINEEYESLKVHKAVLGSYSPVFKAMFEAPMKEKQNAEMIIPDLSPKSMKLVLKFIYSGELHEDWVEAPEEVIQAADRYELPILKEFCDKNLYQLTTTSNALDMLKLCCNLPPGRPGLKFVTDFIKFNVQDVPSLL